MTSGAGDTCLVCEEPTLRSLIVIPNVPIFCNQVYASQLESENAERGDIDLCYCVRHGHIVNTVFDPARLECDRSYENALTFSPRYRQHAQATADSVIGRYNPRKQDHFVPLTGQPIVAPDQLSDDPPDLVIVMNPEYRSEIGSMLGQIGIAATW